jgi:predicted MFS family arabinose efflux permease
VPLTAWRDRRGLVAILAANGFAILGSRVSFVAIPWLVLVTTGSPTQMGLVAGAEMLPYVLASSLGAPLADRLGNRRTAIIADLSSVPVMLAIAAGHTAGFSVLIALVAVLGTLRGFGDNAKKVLVPPQAAQAGVALVRVTAIYDGMSRLTMLIGAPVAGVLVAWAGVSTTIVVSGGMFAVGAGLIVTLVHPPAPPPAPAGGGTAPDQPQMPAKEPYLVALRGGFRHVISDRITFGILAMLFGINLFNQASGAVLIPLWAAEVVQSPTAIGWILGALGLGAVIGNIIFTVLATRAPRYLTFTLGFLIGGPPRFLILGLSDELWLVLAVTFISGLALASVNPIISVLLFERTPPELHARVFGLNTAVAWSGIPFGGLLGGLAAQAFGLDASLVLTGLLYLAVALVPVVGYRSWRVIGRRTPEQQPAEEPDPAKRPA